jgi:predicted nucleic acid-binding protein
MAKMDWLPWLKERWGAVLVPDEVWRELERIGDAQAWAALENARREGWLEVKSDSPMRRFPGFEILHAGEVAAIGLALDSGADWLIVDDGDARRIAKEQGLRIIGLLGLIVWAKQQGKLPRAMDAISMLRQVTGFRVSGQVLAQIAADLGEEA